MSLINKVHKVYTKIPLWVLRVISFFYYLFPEGIRYGSKYAKMKKRIKKYEKLSKDNQIVELEKALKDLITYAYNHVPYYKNLFDANNINPDEINHVSDLDRIPVLTKEILIKETDNLISDEYKKEDLVYISTSGSTGNPTHFYVMQDSPINEIAINNWFLKKHGVTSRDSCLVLRGKKFYAQSKGKCWQWDPFRRQLSIDVFDFSEANLEEYCKAIEKYHPKYAYGYPSAMYSFCKYLKKRSIPLKNTFKCFESISESYTQEEKTFIEDVIKAPLISFYGMSERVIIAHQLIDEKYILSNYYGVTEILDDKDNAIKESGVPGVLFGTSLLNYGMPLIRYKTDDVATWDEYLHSLRNIYGRKTKDALVGKDGSVISLASLTIHATDLDNVFRYQFVQDAPGKVEMKVVQIAKTDKVDELVHYIEVLEKRTHDKVEFTLTIVDSIDPLPNGKVPIVIQNVKF